MAKFDKKLAQILTKRGLIETEKSDELMEKSEGDGKSLTETLVETGTLSENQIIACVSDEMKYPPIDLERVQIDPEVLQIVPEDLARSFNVLPIAKMGNSVTMAVANPFDVLTIDDIKIITNCEPMPVVSTDMAITKAIDKVYDQSGAQMDALFGEIDEDDLVLSEGDSEEDDTSTADLTAGAEDSPVVKLVNITIFQAIKDGASDIHIEAYEKRCRIRYRIDGSCLEALAPPKRMYQSIISRLKIMSEMDIAERYRPQDGKFQMKVQGRQVDFRVSMLPMVHGEKCVMRILDTSNLALGLDSLGFEEKALADFKQGVHAPYGMILVTGPTGSGKSTSLYSAIKEVMNVEDNITTVEEPVEYQLDGINQVPVNAKRGLTFAAALRSILRQDPDTVMIGEIRDLETAEIAVKAALTGHLVLSTLHTNDAPGTVTRLIDMGIDRFMVSSSVVLVSAQRLVRRVCKECKQPEELPVERMMEIGFLEEQTKSPELFKANADGCARCKKGYKGRMALLETLPMNEPIKRIVVDGGSSLDVKRVALENGMETLRAVGIKNALRGLTTLDAVCSVTMADDK